MSHGPAIDLGHDQPPLPNQHFSSWLRSQTTLFLSQIVAILGIISFLASMVYYVSHLSEGRELLRPENLTVIIDFAHIVFMAMFILVLFKILDDNERGSYRVKLVYERVFGRDENESETRRKRREAVFAGRLGTSKKQLKNFKRRFLWFWIGMLVLYVVFACQHSYELVNSGPEASSGHVGSSFSSSKKGPGDREESFEVTFDLSFHVAGEAQAHTATPETAGGDESKKLESKKLSWSEAARQLAFPYLAFLFNNLTLWAIYLCFLVMHIARDKKRVKYRKHWRFSLGAVVLLALPLPILVYFKQDLLTSTQWTNYISIFDALSGVVNATVLALLIARLDSKLIGLPSWLISILYSYAAVQPLFLVFELKHSAVLQAVAVFVLFFVFISKIYFFLIIIYALQTGKMLNYLFCVTALRNQAEKYKHEREKITRATGLLRGDWPRKLSMLLGPTAVIYFVVSLFVPEIRFQDWVIDCIQLVFVLSVLVVLKRLRRSSDYNEGAVVATLQGMFGVSEVPEYAKSKEQGEEELGKFKKYFYWFWVFTFLLYFVFLLEDLHKCFYYFDGAAPDSLLNKVIGLIHTCGDTSQLRLFALMGRILPYPFLEFSLGTLNLMFIFWCFVVLHTPAFGERAKIRQRLMFNYSRFVILLLIAVFPLLFFLIGGQKLEEPEMRGYATVFNGVNGMLSAAALALLIARMDSTPFGLPRWLIAILFVYASLQPLVIAFSLNEEVLNLVRASTLVAALVLKICFFLTVANCLQSGRMINYLVCFPFLRDRVDSIFENQFEISVAHAEHHSYILSILKKNKAYYSIPKRFESRGECDKFVNMLRERMEDKAIYWPPEEAKGAYRIGEASGTYWVEVISPLLGYPICESMPLRSKDEAEAMISESREKIPYCKYNRA